jgi:hypothetical protein
MGERDRAGWQWRMRREIGWLMLAKLAALIILWAAFFSPAHRPSVDGRITADRLALLPEPIEPPTQADSCGEHPCD